MRLYHLSLNPNLSTMIPRVPQNGRTKKGQENNVIKRVCFAPSIHSALVAAPPSEMGAVLYIYIPTSLDEKYVYKPTPSEVPDVSVTHEIWYMAPVSVKRVGVLIVGDEIKHKLFKHPTIKDLEEILIWYNYKRFKRKPTKEEIKKYLSTQSAYQKYLKNYRLGILKGIAGTLAGSVFVLVGSQIKKLLL